MKSIGFTITTFLLVVLLIGGGYFALAGLKDPATYLPEEEETVGDLHQITTEPQTTTNTPPPVISEEPVASTPSAPVTGAQASISDTLQTLIDTKTVLKVGSKGPAVGAVQQFLNAYLKKTTKVDNDFGKTLETNLKAFQKASGISQTGQTGPQTVQAMIEWLKKNPQ